MPSKRKPGTGQIAPLPSGRFRIRSPRLPNGTRPWIGVVDTRDEAEQLLSAYVSRLAERGYASRGGVSLAGHWRDWMQRRELDGYAGAKNARSIWRCHLEPQPWAQLPLKTLTSGDVRRWIERLRTEVGHSYLSQTKTMLVGCLDDAVDRGLVDSNVARAVRLPRAPRSADDPWTYLEPAEQGRLLAACDDAWRHVVGFAIGTGLRGGEQWCLRLSDLELDGDRPHVHVRLGSPNRPPKSGRARVVPLFGLGLASLNAWLDRPQRSNPYGLVFPGPYGGRRKVSRVPAAWPNWLAAAGIDRPLRWHDLRHTAGASLVSGWWGRGWRLEEVQALLGHADIRTTQRYAHLGETALTAAARATTGPIAGPRLGHAVVTAENFRDISSGVSDGIARQPERSREVRDAIGPALSELAANLAGFARDGLGHEAERARVLLVEAVLNSDVVRLALAADKPGPHQMDRALDLAEVILESGGGAVDCRSGSVVTR